MNIKTLKKNITDAIWDFVFRFLARREKFIISLSLMDDVSGSYWPLDVRGKTVVDIGADWGNSPLYWRWRGARKVIAYESDQNVRSRLELLALLHGSSEARGDWLEVHGAWDGSYPDADVLKMDCEGCEGCLDVKMLAKYSQWAIVLHPPGHAYPAPTLHLIPLLQSVGGHRLHKNALRPEQRTKFTDGCEEEVWIKA